MRGTLTLCLMLLANPGLAEEYSGEARLWFTLAAAPYVATGTAGRVPQMSRFPPEALSLAGLRTECFGQADAAGLGFGFCINTAPNGDFWVERYACHAAILPPRGALSACSGTSTILGGTGQFARIEGSGQFTMLTTMTAPDGMQVVYSPGTLDLQW